MNSADLKGSSLLKGADVIYAFIIHSLPCAPSIMLVKVFFLDIFFILKINKLF